MGEYAEQLRRRGLKLSDEGARCAEFVGEYYRGFHHFSHDERKLDWSGRYIEFTTHELLSSFDSSELTRLVLLAHKHCIRVEIKPAMRYLRISLFPRKRDSSCVMERHPSLGELARLVNEMEVIRG